VKLYNWQIALNCRRVRMFILGKGMDLPEIEEVGDQSRLGHSFYPASAAWPPRGRGGGGTLCCPKEITMVKAKRPQKSKPAPRKTSTAIAHRNSDAGRVGSKQGMVIGLLRRPEGATITDVTKGNRIRAFANGNPIYSPCAQRRRRTRGPSDRSQLWLFNDVAGCDVRWE
jgi:hypothetical protein